jgi:hypothetical protein
MRTLAPLLALAAALAFGLARPAQAGPSPRQKLAKLVAKYAVHIDDVFDPNIKLKTLCYCTDGDRTAGFLMYTVAVELVCAVPISYNVEDGFSVVDFSCTDFETIVR